jgi:protein-tyrosine phosphatase
MIDLHCHILPGIDDGPATIDGSLDFARAAAAAGMTTMIATPHVSPRYPNDSRTIAAGVADLNDRLVDEGIDLEVRPGAEISILQVEELAEGELRRLRLGHGPWLLIESPFTQVADGLPMLIGQIQADGHRIVLAHPERCQGFHRRPDLLEAMVRGQGVLTSVTAGALVGDFGRQVQSFALSLAEKGLIHNVASDAHDCERRPPGIAEAMRRAGLGAHIELLTEVVPRAILSGDRLPPLPGALLAERRGGRLWRRSPRPPRDPGQ